MALKNSKTGSLPVSEIYSFMKEHFPSFKVRGLRGGWLEWLWSLPGTARTWAKLSHPFSPLVMSKDTCNVHSYRHGPRNPEREGGI